MSVIQNTINKLYHEIPFSSAIILKNVVEGGELIMGKGVSGSTHTQQQRNNYANQRNSNNSAYRANNSNHANQLNPNNQNYNGKSGK